MLLRSAAPRPSSRRLPLATRYRSTHHAPLSCTRRISPLPSCVSRSRANCTCRADNMCFGTLIPFPPLFPQNRCVGVHCRDLTGTRRTLRRSDLSCKFKCLVHALAVKCSYGKEHHGGESGIRTHEGLPLAGFQDQCLKPLGHLSAPSGWFARIHTVTPPSRRRVRSPGAIGRAPSCGDPSCAR